MLAEILGLDDAALDDAVAAQFKGKAAIELNMQAVDLGRGHIRENVMLTRYPSELRAVMSTKICSWSKATRRLWLSLRRGWPSVLVSDYPQ